MSFGYLYAIDNAVRERLATCVAKSDWYEALGEFNLESKPACNAGESLPAWKIALESVSGPLSSLFSGDLRAQSDEYDDPDVLFLSSGLVETISMEIDRNGKDYFLRLLSEHDLDTDLWLYEPMREFFAGARSAGKAIIMLWGG